MFVRIVLVIAGVYQAVTGAWAIVAPGSFFNLLAAFGARNDHLLFDFGSFAVPLGLALLAAVWWESWRFPVLAVASGHWVLHTVSHFLDTNHHDGQIIGWLEAVGLLGSSAALLLALWLTGRQPARPLPDSADR